nr:MAG TPA: helix-turn-helix domain protein [Caudoviricetes sp.]
MTRYLGTAGVAVLTGLAYNTVTAYRSRGKLPHPDAVIEEGGTETWGWLPETIERWMRERTLGRPGKKASIQWIEDLEDGDIIILTDKLDRETLAAWLVGSCESPADTAREILSHKRNDDKNLPSHIMVCRTPPLENVPAGVTLRDMRRLASAARVTCGDARAWQIVAVLAVTRPHEYDELIAQA